MTKRITDCTLSDVEDASGVDDTSDLEDRVLFDDPQHRHDVQRDVQALQKQPPAVDRQQETMEETMQPIFRR